MLAQSVSGIGLLFIALGGAMFGAIATILVMSYAWQARATARELRMMRYRERIRNRFRRGSEHDEHTPEHAHI
jgi:hypothetical protein